MRRQLAAPVLALLVWASATPSAAAHTILVAASPEPQSIVGGTVNAIELRFDQRITEVLRFTVEGPTGGAVSGTIDSATETVLVFHPTVPITTDGQYIVRYDLISADGDLNTYGYGFRHEPNAPAALALVDTAPTGAGGLPVGIVFISTLAIDALVISLHRRTRPPTTKDTTS